MDKKISVIMGIYNCEKTLPKALDSLLMQTYQNFEIIMCDDASTDDTYKIAKNYKDRFPDKIILIRNETNQKLAYSLNKCLENASGHYIARMDGDDYCDIDRFRIQVDCLESNDDIQLCGTYMQMFSSLGLGPIVKKIEYPQKKDLANKVPFNHATIMTYKWVYDNLGGYTVSKYAQRCEDCELWFRFYHKGYKGKNISKPLYYVREDEKAVARRTRKLFIYSYFVEIKGYKLLGFNIIAYFKLTCRLILRLLTPQKAILWWRKVQKKKQNSNTI